MTTGRNNVHLPKTSLIGFQCRVINMKSHTHKQHKRKQTVFFTLVYMHVYVCMYVITEQK